MEIMKFSVVMSKPSLKTATPIVALASFNNEYLPISVIKFHQQQYGIPKNCNFCPIREFNNPECGSSKMQVTYMKLPLALLIGNKL